MLKKVVYIITGMAVLVAAMSFIVPGKLTISFTNYVGSSPLKLDSATYTNALGQAYTVSKFKYYIGNITLQKKDGGKFISDKYFLVNEEDEASKQIVLDKVPEGNYTTLTFTLGVDSLHNCGGAQDGALDPVNAMFWTWNTGYIYLKMEGKSPASKSPGNLLEFHIGGYRQPYNCIRTITLNLKDRNITGESHLHIKTDLSEMFKTPTDIDFAQYSSITDFHHSTLIADNYKDMFSIML